MLGAALALPAGRVLAQSGSGRPIRVVVPLPAGSSNDYVTRVVAPYLTASLGQTIVVDNKAGGNGIIGTMDVVKAAPDGNTLLLGSLSPLATNMALLKNLPYDPRKDLTPIAGVSVTNWVLMVNSSSPIRTLAEFVADAKKRPGSVSIGYSTTTVQVQIATLNKVAGIELLPVPYKGTPATITDVLGGSLNATLLDPGNALSQAKGGKMRVLGVSSLKRNPTTPDWPAISETYPGFDFGAWNALMGPAGMPRDAVVRINAAMNAALKQKDVIEKYAEAGTIPLVMTPEDVKAYIEAEVGKWTRLAREANIQPESI
ncbi:MAG: tripartite tricarboxylate transporter substrate binding protein [Burkholderiales bacterium]|nr:tripartite tricarboxylate transporter substrate binding protein [Burkholderiales bacterium]